MPYHNDTDVGLLQCIHHIQVFFSRNTENVFHAFLFQALHKNLRGGTALLLMQ